MTILCALGENCDRYDRRTDSPGLSYGFNLCDSCDEHYARDIKRLLYDYVDLSQIIARPDGHSEAKITRPKPQSLPPVDVNVFTLRSDIEQTLTDAANLVRAQYPPFKRHGLKVREGYSVQASVSLLGARVDTLSSLVGGADLLLRLRGLHLLARKVLGRGDLNIALPGTCDKCQFMALSRRDGSETVVCGSCGHAIPWHVYRQLVTLRITTTPLISVRLTRNQEP